MAVAQTAQAERLVRDMCICTPSTLNKGGKVEQEQNGQQSGLSMLLSWH